MDLLVAYFGTIPSSHRALILAGGIAFFWVWESAAPFMRTSAWASARQFGVLFSRPMCRISDHANIRLPPA